MTQHHNTHDLHIAPFPFQEEGGAYQFSARWEDILNALPPNKKNTNIRGTGFILRDLNVLWDGEAPFVNLDEINGESVWVVYWNSPYDQQ